MEHIKLPIEGKTRSAKEILECAKYFRSIGMEPPGLSTEERKGAFGDEAYEWERDNSEVRAMFSIAKKIENKEPVSKADRRAVSAYIKSIKLYFAMTGKERLNDLAGMKSLFIHLYRPSAFME